MTRVAALLCVGLCCSAEWLTYGHDPQRSGYNPSTTELSPTTAGNLGLLWQVQLDNMPVALSALTAPVVADHVVLQGGPATLVYVAGSSNTFFAVDAKDGKVVWNRTFTSFAAPKEDSFYLCPNTPNATPVIDRERGRIYTIAADGRLYGLDLATGTVNFGPFAFIPPFAKAWSLNLRDDWVYTTTSQSCGGDRSGIYSMRISDPMHVQSREVLVRRGYGGGLWLRGGTVISPDGTVYAATGDGVFNPATGDYSNSYVAATADLSRIYDYLSPANWKQIDKRDLDLPSGGLVEFTYQGRHLLAGGGKESVIYVMDARSLGGDSHQVALYTSPLLANETGANQEFGLWGSPAAWTAPDQETWLYFPVWGKLAATAPRFPIGTGTHCTAA